jgi:hypothetical protein
MMAKKTSDKLALTRLSNTLYSLFPGKWKARINSRASASAEAHGIYVPDFSSFAIGRFNEQIKTFNRFAIEFNRFCY